MAHPILESQDALKAILAARGAWAGVDIRDGSPTEGEDVTNAAFWFNDVIGIVGDWASLGNPAGGNRRRLNYTLGFSIMARTLGDDERSTRQIVLDLFDDLEVAIKANPALGIPATVQQTGEVSGSLGSSPVMPDGWGAIFTGSIECLSRAY